ncbi:hypothetical protein M3Y99_01214200 [Aphelenchoides fujianensis]|nr:hypothetical protein M3Y99_01214200 [Aphelenchoides fujianensis]
MNANVVFAAPTPPEPSVSATELLSIAVRKRKEICGRKNVGLHRNVTTKNLIRLLCKELGQSRVRSRSRSTSRRRRRSSSRDSSAHKRRLPADSEVPLKKPLSELYDYQQVDYEEHCGLYIDEGHGGGQCAAGTGVQTGFNRFSADQGSSLIAANRLEQPDQKMDAEKPEFHGYIGEWSKDHSDGEVPVLLDLDRPAGRPEPKDESSSSRLSSLQPAEKPGAQAEEFGGLDLNDPLNLSELFKSSYSIMEPRDVAVRAVLVVAVERVEQVIPRVQPSLRLESPLSCMKAKVS